MGMGRWIWVVALSTLASLGGVPSGQTGDTARGPMADLQKTVWNPGPGGDQVAIWPQGVAIRRPESDRPEEVGRGSELVAGRPWHYATYVSRPTMTIYKPMQQNSHAAILVLPGGGYAALAMDLEGSEICDWITHIGVTCVLLKYRVPQAWRHGQDRVEKPPDTQLPLQDAQRAMSLLRDRASSYDIDPGKIGVVGFSAGGHLAAAISNAETRAYEKVDAADEQSSRPDFAILLYPGHLWDETSAKQSLTLSPWVTVNPKAPPTLLFHAMNDATDDVRHSLAYGLALSGLGVPVEMHFYAAGGHAFGIRPTSAPITTEWPRLAEIWLRGIRVLDKPT